MFFTDRRKMEMVAAMTRAGFDRGKCFEDGVNPDIEPGHYPPWTKIVGRHDHEHVKPATAKDGYNGENWYLFGAWK